MPVVPWPGGESTGSIVPWPGTATTAPPKPQAITPQPGGAFSHDQLKQLWIKHGGDPHVADLMAHAAYAESTGDPNSNRNAQTHYVENGRTYYPRGLWQISTVHGTNQNWFDPDTNAAEAVALYNAQGMKPWESSRNQGAGGGWGKYQGSDFDRGSGIPIPYKGKSKAAAAPHLAAPKLGGMIVDWPPKQDTSASANPMDSPNMSSASTSDQMTHSAMIEIAGHQDLPFIIHNAQLRDADEKTGEAPGIWELLHTPGSHVAQAWAMYTKNPGQAMDEYGMGSPAQNKYMASHYPTTGEGRYSSFMQRYPIANAIQTFLAEGVNPMAYAEGGIAGRVVGGASKLAHATGVADAAQATAKQLSVGTALYDLGKRGGVEGSQWAKGAIASIKSPHMLLGLPSGRTIEKNIFGGLTNDEQREVQRLYQGLKPNPAFAPKHEELMARAALLRQDMKAVTGHALRTQILKKNQIFSDSPFFPMKNSYDFGPQAELENQLRGASGPGSPNFKLHKSFANYDESLAAVDEHGQPILDKNYSPASNYTTYRSQVLRRVAFEDAITRVPASLARKVAPGDFRDVNAQSMNVMRYQTTRGEAETSPLRGSTYFSEGLPSQRGFHLYNTPGSTQVVSHIVPQNPLTLKPVGVTGEIAQEAIAHLDPGGEKLVQAITGGKAGDWAPGGIAAARDALKALGVSSNHISQLLKGSPQVALDRIAAEMARKHGYDSIILRDEGKLGEVSVLDKDIIHPGSAPQRRGDILGSPDASIEDALHQWAAEGGAEQKPTYRLTGSPQWVAAVRVMRDASNASPALKKLMVAPELWKYLSGNTGLRRYIEQGSYLPGEEQTWGGKFVSMMRNMIISAFWFHPGVNVSGADAAARSMYNLGGNQWEVGGYLHNAAKAYAQQAGLRNPMSFVKTAKEYSDWLQRALVAGGIAEFGEGSKSALMGNASRVLTEPQTGMLGRLDKALSQYGNFNRERTFGTKGEESFAVHLFKDAVERGKMSDPQAGQMVRQALGDYYNFDPKSKWSAIMLFAPWLKSISKEGLKTLVNRPQITLAPAHMTRNANLQNAPEQLQGPFPPNDSTLYLGKTPVTPPNVFRDVSKIVDIAGAARQGPADMMGKAYDIIQGRMNPLARTGVDALNTIDAMYRPDVAGPETNFNMIVNPKAPPAVQWKQAMMYGAAHYVPIPLFGYVWQDALRRGLSPEDFAKALVGASGLGYVGQDRLNPDQKSAVKDAQKEYKQAWDDYTYDSHDSDALQKAWDTYMSELKDAGAINE